MISAPHVAWVAGWVPRAVQPAVGRTVGLRVEHVVATIRHSNSVCLEVSWLKDYNSFYLFYFIFQYRLHLSRYVINISHLVYLIHQSVNSLWRKKYT